MAGPSPRLGAAPSGLSLLLSLALLAPASAQSYGTAPAQELPVVARPDDPPPVVTTPAGVEGINATLWMQRAVERRALTVQAFAIARDRLDEAIVSPRWTAALEQSEGYEALPPAVIVDVDETVLDNHYYQARLILDGASFSPDSWTRWCIEASATPTPGALEFCRYAASRGVTVFYVTNRKSHEWESTLTTLAALGFPIPDDGRTLVTRDSESDKGARRAAVAADYRVLLLVGDSAGDFTSLLESGADGATSDFDAAWGERWIVLPNPMYGSWERAPYAGDRWLTVEEQRERKVAAMLPTPPEVVGHRAGTHTSVAFPDQIGRSAPAPAAEPSAIAAGPMPAWTEVTESSVWLQTAVASDVQLRYWPVGRPEAAQLTPSHRADATNDYIAAFALGGLQAGTRYAYEVYVDGDRHPAPWPLAFATRPLWLWRSPDPSRRHAPPDFTFAIGSCTYVNEPPYDRPGAPYGGDYQIFDAIAARAPDFMFWLGDNVYHRGPDWFSEEAMRRRYAHTRAVPELQRLLAATHHYAIWDDHDFGPNDSDRTFRLREESLRVFTDYWPGMSYGLADTPGTFQRFRWADAEFFLLDDRFWRSPNDARESAGKTMLGARQFAWLTDGLRSSRATFKFVVNGGQMLNPIVKYEGFGEFPDEQEELFRFLTAEGIEGVVFLSGDRHHTELLKVTRGRHHPWYEFTSSPLTSSPVDRDLDGDHPARVPGTFLAQRSFGTVSIVGPHGQRRLVLKAFDSEGNELWSHEIGQDELRVEP